MRARPFGDGYIVRVAIDGGAPDIVCSIDGGAFGVALNSNAVFFTQPVTGLIYGCAK